MLDLITSTLLVFMLITTLQTLLGNDDMEAALARSKQELFLAEFRHEFAPELRRKEIRVDRHLNFVQIRFSDRVLFISGDYRLQTLGRDLLGRCAAVLSGAGESGYEQIQVEGHTDNVPLGRTQYPSNNWELSTARALSVVELLGERNHALMGVLSANGYASYHPVADNSTLAGRDLNRRIEIRLFFSGTQASGARARARSSES
jgi:chemotaxis protein MotB